MIQSAQYKSGVKYYIVALMSPMEKKAFNAHRGMMVRCYTKSSSGYKKYGAKGIGVCRQWHDNFEQFLADVGLPASDDLSLERKNNDLGYEPGNVKWGTEQEQHDNRSNTFWIPINGVSKPASTWAREYSIPPGTLWQRYQDGMRGEDLIRPVGFNRPKYDVGAGRELTMAEIHHETGINRGTIQSRLEKGVRGPDLLKPARPMGSWRKKSP